MVTVFGLRLNLAPPGISQEAASMKNCAMTLITIDDLLPEDLDLASIFRDARSALTAPENDYGGDATHKRPNNHQVKTDLPTTVEASLRLSWTS